MIERIMRAWCRHFHKRISWPTMRGEYRCLVCLREYRAAWVEDRVTFEIQELERLYVKDSHDAR